MRLYARLQIAHYLFESRRNIQQDREILTRQTRGQKSKLTDETRDAIAAIFQTFTKNRVHYTNRRLKAELTDSKVRKST